MKITIERGDDNDNGPYNEHKIQTTISDDSTMNDLAYVIMGMLVVLGYPYDCVVEMFDDFKDEDALE